MTPIFKSAAALTRFVCRAAVVLGVSAAVTSAFAGAAAALSLKTKAREAYLVDFETGTVLFDKNGTQRMPPSSMSKLMTTAMVFERLKEGALSLEDHFKVSANAWRTGGAASGSSTMFLDPNSEVSVEDLLRGVIVQSGNDACIALAENLMGSEAAFAEAMTVRAREIGLTNSHFTNSTGLSDPEHYMTARDLAALAKYIITEFPDFYGLYSETEFTYNKIRQNNRNPLLYTMRGADGLKTGHTSAAGYGLTASAQKGGRRQILVINGLKSARERSEEARKLMQWGFANFDNKTLFTKGETVDVAEVWLGELATVPLTTAMDVRFTLPRRAVRDMDVKVIYTGPLPAPVTKGDTVAKLVISGPDIQTPIEVPLQAAQDVERLGFFGRIAAAVKHLVFGVATQAEGAP